MVYYVPKTEGTTCFFNLFHSVDEIVVGLLYVSVILDFSVTLTDEI